MVGYATCWTMDSIVSDFQCKGGKKSVLELSNRIVPEGFPSGGKPDQKTINKSHVNCMHFMWLVKAWWIDFPFKNNYCITLCTILKWDNYKVGFESKCNKWDWTSLVTRGKVSENRASKFSLFQHQQWQWQGEVTKMFPFFSLANQPIFKKHFTFFLLVQDVNQVEGKNKKVISKAAFSSVSKSLLKQRSCHVS